MTDIKKTNQTFHYACRNHAEGVRARIKGRRLDCGD